ncbi:MAG: hypothetical protein ACK4E0_14555 [Chitinophagaceae bacterium]
MKKWTVAVALALFAVACNDANNGTNEDNSRENPSDSMYPMKDDPHYGQPSDTANMDTTRVDSTRR